MGPTLVALILVLVEEEVALFYLEDPLVVFHQVTDLLRQLQGQGL